MSVCTSAFCTQYWIYLMSLWLHILPHSFLWIFLRILLEQTLPTAAPLNQLQNLLLDGLWDWWGLLPILPALHGDGERGWANEKLDLKHGLSPLAFGIWCGLAGTCVLTLGSMEDVPAGGACAGRGFLLACFSRRCLCRHQVPLFPSVIHI